MLHIRDTIIRFRKNFRERAVSACKSPFAVFIALALILTLFNAFQWAEPRIAQVYREHKASTAFDDYWEREGAPKFRAAGVEPTETVYKDERNAYMQKFYRDNLPLVPQERVDTMKVRFREWWETEGKASFVITQNIVPDKALYDSELEKYLKKYTDTEIIFQLMYVPGKSSVASVFTTWILAPGVFSFLIFITGFLFAAYMLTGRWGMQRTLGAFLTSLLATGIIAAATLPLCFFCRYGAYPYEGASLSLAFLLGAVCKGRRDESIPKSAVIVSGIFLFLDMFVNWTVNEDLYGWIAILSPFVFAGGVFAGKMMPPRKRTAQELAQARLNAILQRNPGDLAAERKARTRKDVNEGIKLMNAAEYKAAEPFLERGIRALLQETPIDTAALKDAVQKMLSPNYFLEFPSVQWLEWGITAAEKDIPDVAISLLEKNLTMEKDAGLARKALFRLGELRVLKNIDAEAGKARLRKVIEMKGDDLLASEAKRILAKAEAAATAPGTGKA